MKAKVLLVALGLAVAGLVTAVVLFDEHAIVPESSPNHFGHDPVTRAAPVNSPEPSVNSLESLPPAASVQVSEQPLAADERSEVAAPVIRGRVVEAEVGTGLAGFAIQLNSRRETLARAVSDEQGRFELPFPKAERLTLEVVEGEGWKATRRRQRLSSEAPPAEEIVFELRRSSRSYFRGRAIDEASGDPLPYLRLAVGSWGEELETDADGLFTTRQQFEPGEISILLVTGSGGRWMNSERKVVHDGSGSAHDVALTVGPSYDLNVAAPPGYALGDLRAFLADPGQECPWTVTNDPRDGEPLHSDSAAWVRFLDPIDDPPQAALATLWIATADGRWLGSSPVPPASRRGSGAFEIALAPCGSVEVALRVEGNRRAPDAEVELRRPDGEECWGPHWGAEQDDRHRFHLVPPGEYVLHVESNRAKTIERSVRIAAGDPTVVELALESLPRGGSISGFVRSQSGQFKAADQVELSRSGEHADSFHTEVHWSKEGGSFVGRFEFDDVPAGEYELSSWGSSQFEWRSSPATVAPPAADIELLCLDGAGGIRLEVEAFDARTGKPVSELEVSFGRSGSQHHSFSFSVDGSHRLELGRFPRDVALEWEATCGGYVPIAGDLSSFQQVGTEEGEPLLRARLELQPGWGGRVLAYTETERIEGAVVLCDDVEVGRTNKRGELDIVLPARPKRFEVRHPSCVMEYPTTGQLPDDAAVLLVYMKPRE